MDYFIISQDERITNYAEPLGLLNIFSKYAAKAEDEASQNIPIVVNVKEKADCDYISFIQRPVPMVSDKLKILFEMYQPGISFKPIVFNDVKKMRQELYWNTTPRRVECLSSESIFNKDNSLKKLVIDVDKVEFVNIFSIEGILENYIIVNQDVAESILRRDLWGIQFVKVQVSGYS